MTTTGRRDGSPGTTSRASWVGADLLFGAAVLATVVGAMVVGRGTWFFADEWAMAEQVREPAGLFRQYNGHLSILILGLYRVLLELFGFGSYTPYRLAGVLSFVSVAVAAYVVFRREAGAVVAAIVGALLLWPRGISLEPGGLNHSLSALGAVICAYGLNATGRRRDLVAAGGLAFALASAGGGVAVLAAALVHTALTRARWQRWVAVAVPSVAWIIWYLVAVPADNELVRQSRPGKVTILRLAVENAFESFSTLAFGNRVGGVLVALGVAVVLVARLRVGLAAAAGTLAWLAGLGAWWLGLTWSRWLLLDFPTFRYDFVSMVLILLALLPPRLPDGASVSLGALGRWRDDTGVARLLAHRGAAPLAFLVAAAVLAPSFRGDLTAWGDEYRPLGEVAEAKVITIGFGDGAVPDDAMRNFNLGSLSAGQLRTLMEVYRPPDGYGELEALLDRSVDASEPTAPDTVCAAASDRTVEVPPSGALVVSAPASTAGAEVRVGRFGADPIEVATVPAGQKVTFQMQSFEGDAPWRAEVTGGCASAR